MRIVIAGTGYVGLVTGACLASLGHHVVCADRDKEKIAALKRGKPPIHEPGLGELIQKHAATRLSFTTALTEHVAAADMVMIAVGTPSLPSGEADLGAVFTCGRDMAPHLRNGQPVVIKSTVPPGTAARLAREIEAANPALSPIVASNPEFLREGAAIRDFMAADRIVVGLRERSAEPLFQQLYAPLTEAGTPLVFMSNEAAELTKYAANTYLAMRIAYVNQLADICEAVGADIGDVTGAMGLDQRIGLHYLAPGPGFGGSCFPKDTRALLAATQAAGVDFPLGEAIISANEQRRQKLSARVIRALDGRPAGKRVGVLGIAFKANTDDTRDSAALPLIEALIRRGAHVSAHDPAAPIPEGVQAASDPYEAVRCCDAVVVMTEWDRYRQLDLKRLASVMRRPVMVDFRNLYALADAAAAGLSYISIGRAGVERLAWPRPKSRPRRAQAAYA
ncbi:UDP-glucose dehydrogenase family protein [Aestuariivirga sp.]|uniref:UDP-glucose dehydrogenase family protein n=1 Tax=Aestuariivirga sp. TaxID=2650926 RepID=UPI0039E55711